MKLTKNILRSLITEVLDEAIRGGGGSLENAFQSLKGVSLVDLVTAPNPRYHTSQDPRRFLGTKRLLDAAFISGTLQRSTEPSKIKWDKIAQEEQNYADPWWNEPIPKKYITHDAKLWTHDLTYSEFPIALKAEWDRGFAADKEKYG
jgi:hypothetical protein